MKTAFSSNCPGKSRKYAILLFVVTAGLMAGFSGAARADYFDCKTFDDRNLCKLLNRYPAVKDLPVITAARIADLYRTKPGYAEDLLEDHPVVIEGSVASKEEKSGRVTVTLNESTDPATAIVLQLFATHPVAGDDGRVKSRTAQEVQAILRDGRLGVFQCVGDGVKKKIPVFKNCVLWR
ncbi:hypothetical protein VVD49_12940 [Uliginosibacterium sp. H3]|uniref:tRNA_anti-like n=1 Tax=Uliginosibacterium silvisoli TaxID=3114758 RepID=A0ABU6K4K3_9RHOO|nr:hypothetical protein [Uliginosibacterium sp. H3]